MTMTTLPKERERYMQLKWPSESSVETFWPPLNSNYCTTLGYPMFKSQANTPVAGSLDKSMPGQ